MDRVERIELSPNDWKSPVLPLNYTRIWRCRLFDNLHPKRLARTSHLTRLQYEVSFSERLIQKTACVHQEFNL